MPSSAMVYLFIGYQLSISTKKILFSLFSDIALVGMQHLVECICVGPTEKRYYLCTLCQLTFATHMIIKHVLSFDHIHTYFVSKLL